MTAYPPEWYTDAELTAGRAADEQAAVANEADAAAAGPDPWASNEPDVDDLTRWADAAAELAQDPAATPAGDFYGWHADNGHAPQWDGAGGVACGSCGETYPAPQPEPEAG